MRITSSMILILSASVLGHVLKNGMDWIKTSQAAYVPEVYATAIRNGCGFNKTSNILCVSEGCFKSPELIYRGPIIETILSAPIPSFVTLRHETQFFAKLVHNLSTPRSIECSLRHLSSKWGTWCSCFLLWVFFLPFSSFAFHQQSTPIPHPECRKNHPK